MKKRVYLVAVASVMALSLVGCGSSSSKHDSYASSTTESSWADDGYYDESWDMADAEEAAGSNGTSADSLSDKQSTDSDYSEKIITTYHYDVETLEYDDLITKISDRVSEYGGYIENSSMDGSKEWSTRYCRMTIRIPKKNAVSFLGMVEGESNVTSMSSSTENVTLQYVDLQSHIESLQAEQEALLSMLEVAESISDIIVIQDQLTSVRYQIESYESQLRVLANRVSFDTIYLNVNEVKEATVVEPLSYSEEMSQGLTRTFRSIGNGFKNFWLVFVIALPLIIVWAAIFGGIAAIVVSIVKYNKRRKPFRDAQKREKEAKRTAEVNKKLAAKAAKKGQPVPVIAQNGTETGDGNGASDATGATSSEYVSPYAKATNDEEAK